MIEYQLIRSKRKSVAIYIREDGSVQVRAPGWVSKTEIQKMIGEKADWIQKKRQEAADKNCARQKYYTEGAVFLCLEKEYVLHLTESERNAVYVREREDRLLVVKTRSLEEAYMKDLLIKWSAGQLRRYIRAAVDRYLPELRKIAEQKGKEQEKYAEGSSHMRIAVKNVKTRWGSCSAKGHLNFSVKLVMAPASIIDYVIVHELCHLLYMNHGPEFWEAVTLILPDCRERRRYLKENGWQYEF
ncbi:MAG: SprT family zinc-dependent metalloprotease [Lachnospiraceae bacterium]